MSTRAKGKSAAAASTATASAATASAAAASAATAKVPVKPTPQSMPYEQGKWAFVFAPRAKGERRYWLVKSEPDVFSFDDLVAAPQKTTGWDCVRNSTARNFLRDGMMRGDLVFYYHSNADPSAIVGVCEVVREGYPDAKSFDKASEYFDAKSHPDAPTWFMVDLRAVAKLKRPVTLLEVKAMKALSDMALVRQGRLSVTPVTAAEWDVVMALGARGK